MARLKIRHFAIRRSGYYFQPTKAMRAAGLRPEPLGKDLARAIARAEQLNAEWDKIRRGLAPGTPTPPAGSFSALVDTVQASQEYKDKKPRTREELDYAIRIMQPVFGPARLDRITGAHCRKFYDGLRAQGSVHRAAKIMKWLRYLLTFAVRYDLLAVNPARAVRIKAPAARTEIWEAGQVRAFIGHAWESGERGLACIAAVIYDTSLRPSDARGLEAGQIRLDDDPEGEHYLMRPQVKTGRPVKLPLWPETAALIRAYRDTAGFATLPDQPLFRTREGRPYTKDYLTRVSRRVRADLGLAANLQLRDLRRTASKERADSEATAVEIAAGGGWSIGRGQQILDVYNPTTYKNARSAQAKRGRKLIGGGSAATNSGSSEAEKLENLRPRPHESRKSGGSDGTRTRGLRRDRPDREPKK